MTAVHPVTAPSLIPYRAVSEIIVPVTATDLHDRGVRDGAAYAAAWGVPIRLIHVRLADDESLAAEVERLGAMLHARHPELIGVTSEEIVADTIEDGIEQATTDTSLVVVATDRARREATTQSIAARMLRTVHSVMLLVGPHNEPPRFDGHILVLLDGSERAERAIDPALALANAHDTQLRLLNVVSPITTAHVAKLREEGESVSESGYIRSVATRLREDSGNVHWGITHGEDVAQSVAHFVDHHDVRMVVAATHGASDRQAPMLGSTCLELVERLPVPVLVVRPELATEELAPEGGETPS